jgi:transcriptional regulator with XRE-family HTH domain
MLLKERAMTIGANIKKLREARGLTQESIFKQVGLSTSYQSQIENGAGIGKKTIEKYIEALGVDEETIRFGERTDLSFDRRKSPLMRSFVDKLSGLSEPEQHILYGRMIQMIEEGLK